MDELDPLARRELRAAYKQVQDYTEHLTAARAAMARAAVHGGPDLTTRVDTLLEWSEGLLKTIDEVAPPFEPHAAHRGEVPPRPASTIDSLPEHHSRR